MNALQASKLCNVTGVISIACGWHGCYTPQALVDLFRGEQQKNVGFSLLKALMLKLSRVFFSSMTSHANILFIYRTGSAASFPLVSTSRQQLACSTSMHTKINVSSDMQLHLSRCHHRCRGDFGISLVITQCHFPNCTERNTGTLS